MRALPRSGAFLVGLGIIFINTIRLVCKLIDQSAADLWWVRSRRYADRVI